MYTNEYGRTFEHPACPKCGLHNHEYGYDCPEEGVFVCLVCEEFNCSGQHRETE